MVGGEEAGGRIGDRGVIAVRGAHDRGGLDRPIDCEDASRAVSGGEGDIKPGRLCRRGRGRQVEIDLGHRRGKASGTVGDRGLNIIPVIGVVAGSHHEADTVRILASIV